jgi:hypothetical protein
MPEHAVPSPGDNFEASRSDEPLIRVEKPLLLRIDL